MLEDEQFRQLCNVYGFAPSRALRELIDCVRAQEIEACAGLAERRLLDDDNADRRVGHHHACKSIAADIRARKDKQ